MLELKQIDGDEIVKKIKAESTPEKQWVF